MLNKKRHIHFIGIGGIGMSALAEIIHRQGFTVSGSDQSANEQTEHLKNLGITVFTGHRAGQVQGDFVVYSSAIGEDNPELAEARRKSCLCIKRAELLGEFLRGKKGIAIAGTHGKTTTSAMTGMMLVHARLDPTLFVGGVITEIQSNTRLGDSEWVVVEADEYDRSFLQLNPWISVINNIEADHLDCYQGIDDLKNTFTQFANQTSVFGLVLVNADQAGSHAVIPSIRRPVMTYGLSEQADIRANQIQNKNGRTEFQVTIKQEPMGMIRLNLTGEHQITNALACIGAGYAVGISFPVIQSSLENFKGTHRRFEIVGVKNGVTWIDDYAHHPTEIQATLKAARERFPDQRIIAVFQPHLYSRTRDFLNEFAGAFSDADLVWLTDIYAAREKPVDSINWSETLYSAVKTSHTDAHYVPDKHSLIDNILRLTKSSDVIITMGAGDITVIGREYIKNNNE